MAKNQSRTKPRGLAARLCFVRDQKQKMVVIVGPTASGKSGLALRLALWLRSGRIAKQFGIKGGEIISADSRQVYRGMDIGTGKVTKKEQGSVKHHLLDVADPKKVFTVSDFKKFGKKALDNIASRNRLPVIVGGTGFYVDALVRNIAMPEVPPNKKLRVQFDKLTAEKLFEKLRRLDARRAKTIDPKNKRRLIRALEIVLTTGKPVPNIANGYLLMADCYDTLWLGLKPKSLEKRIKSRLEKRLRQGIVKEVNNLLKKGVSKKRLHDFGLEYRWASRYLNKEINYKEMKEGLLRNIIKYSKRQMTWFKRNKEIHWVKNQKEAEKLVSQFIL